MEQLKELLFPLPSLEEEPDLLWAPMEQMEQPWAPVEQDDQGRHGLLADQQLRLASAAAVGLQMADNAAYDDDILRLLKEPQDEGDLDAWLAGLPEEITFKMKGTGSWIGRTHSFPSKKRGARKKRMSPWVNTDRCPLTSNSFANKWVTGLHVSDPTSKRSASEDPLAAPLFFEGRRLTGATAIYGPRKNNSHWTQQEVELLVEGISKFGIGRWSELKEKYFKRSVRTSVHIKDKWRNLLKAYDVQWALRTKKEKVQNKTLLHLEEPLVKRIRELAKEQRRGTLKRGRRRSAGGRRQR